MSDSLPKRTETTEALLSIVSATHHVTHSTFYVMGGVKGSFERREQQLERCFFLDDYQIQMQNYVRIACRLRKLIFFQRISIPRFNYCLDNKIMLKLD